MSAETAEAPPRTVTCKPNQRLQARECGACGNAFAKELMSEVSVETSLMGDPEAPDPEVRAVCPGCVQNMGFRIVEGGTT